MARVSRAKRMRSDRRFIDRTTLHRNIDDSFSPKIVIRDHKFIFVCTSLFVVSVAICVSYYFCGSYMDEGYNHAPVYLRGLVKSNISYQEILTENENENILGHDSSVHPTHPLLGYITPWNPKGYDLARKFGSKFSHLSPVWYNIRSEGGNLFLDGLHNFDGRWVSDLRAKNHTKIIPRVVLEVNPYKFLTKRKWRVKAVELITTECIEMDYDGVVLESWSTWAAYGVLHNLNMRNKGLGFIKLLGNTLHSLTIRTEPRSRLHLVYVIPPQVGAPSDFTKDDMNALAEAVDGFSLMTYDFSAPHTPGPNAPLEWIRASMSLLLDGRPPTLNHMMFLGINFYGYDFTLLQGAGGGAITGKDYLRVLKEEEMEEAVWDEKSGEHIVFYRDGKGVRHAVFYPTLLSVSLRLDEARSLGTGVAVWELGQGLDYFFHIF